MVISGRSIRLIVSAILLSFSVQAFGVAPEPILEYKFNELGTVVWNSGSDPNSSSGPNPDTRLTMYDANSWDPVDLHSDSGLGLSGEPGDRALDLTSATNMGLTTGGTGPRASAAGRPPEIINQLKSFTLTGWFKTDTNPLPGIESEEGTGIGWGAYLIDCANWDADEGFRLVGQGPGLGALQIRVDGNETYNSPHINWWSEEQEWVFFAVTYDGTIGFPLSNTYFYRGSKTDGLLKGYGVGVYSGTVEDIADTMEWFTLGNRGTHWGFPFDGYMDNIRVYGSKTDNSGALSQLDLEGIWAEDVLPVGESEPDRLVPLVEYKFNETGTSVRSTGQYNDSTYDLTLYNDLGNPTDLHSAGGVGVSGYPGDKAFDNTASTGMGDYQFGGYAQSTECFDAINRLRSLTICGWFMTDSTEAIGNAADLIKFLDNGVQGFWLRGEGLGLLKMRVDDADNPMPGPVGTDVAWWDATQQWVFFAATYDGTTGTDNIRFYMGSETQTVVQIGAPASYAAGILEEVCIDNQRFTVGGGGGVKPVDGYIDNIRIFGSKVSSQGVLTASELEQFRKKDLALYLDADLNKNFYIDTPDVAEFADQWLNCNAPDSNDCY